MARRIFIILAFILALDLAIPVVNAMSPFSAAYTTQPSNDPGFGVTKVVGQSGCSRSTQATNGSYTCSAAIAGSAGQNGILGPIVSTILVFGNFFAAAGFLAQIAGGVIIPSYYMTQWFGGSNMAAGLAAFVVAVQGLIWLAYADGIFYIISGRDLLG